MPNPSSIAQHFEEELEGQRAIASDLRLPKADREAALRRVRSIEDTLGIESEPYNGRPAGARVPTREEYEAAHRVVQAFLNNEAIEGRIA